MEHQISTQQFKQLQYRKFGNGPQSVVLLHGFPEEGSLWRLVWPELARFYTVIVPDLPGAGGSSLPEAPLSMELMADAVHEILQAEGLEQVVLAGHSMGGYTALAFAHRYPGMLRGLALVHSSALADDEDKKESRRKAIELIRKGGREPFIRQMMPNLFAPGFREQRPDVLQEQTERGLAMSDEGLISFYNAMINREDRRDVLSDSALPLMWVIGAEDGVVTPEKALQQTHLSDVSNIEVYEGVGHMSMLEAPERLSAGLLTFVAYCFND